ncbi:pro-opiomelanocortin-like [Solea senegalensis]|nr:pro-opiomelanocortin-like [Solea senegalensis]KAG7453864.1 pro-opiomelanocortin-like [Solea senegalensis]
MCPVWLLVAATVLGVARGSVTNQCWEHPSCQEVNDERSMMECVRLCRSDLSAEEPLVPGDGHLQPPPLSSLALSSSSSSSSSSSPQAKRAYSMEHFRWGKPVGKKRRPITVYSSNSVEEEFPEVLRQELGEADVEQHKFHNVHEKKDGAYKMKHFRWSDPPASKRYDELTERRGDGEEAAAQRGGAGGGR